MEKLFKIDEIKQTLMDTGYFATDELVTLATKNINKILLHKGQMGQDIVAWCLEGPTGSGKTEFAKTYGKILNKVLNENVEFLEYQCNNTTGKSDLFEEVDIKAVIKQDAQKAIIKGRLSEAIDLVNKGKRVILFIDEYDKAQDSTDDFLLSFLQSGQLFSTQLGELKIKDEYKSNLHVILCKNNNREKLSPHLERRLQFIYLEQMKPELFYKIACSKFGVENADLINLVSNIYNELYLKQTSVERLPACSELLIAIQDAKELLEMGMPLKEVYRDIQCNLLKDKNDRDKLCDILKNSTTKEVAKLGELFDFAVINDNRDFRDIIVDNRMQEIDARIKRIELMEKTLKEKLNFNNLKNNATKNTNNVDTEKNNIYKVDYTGENAGDTIAINNEFNLKKALNISNIEKNVEDMTNKNYTDVSIAEKDDWIEIVDLTSNAQGIDIKNIKSDSSMECFKDGKVLSFDNGFKLGFIKTSDDDNASIKILSNLSVVPAVYFDHVIEGIKKVLESNDGNVNFDISLLLSNDEKILSENVQNYKDFSHFTYNSENVKTMDCWTQLNEVKVDIVPKACCNQEAIKECKEINKKYLKNNTIELER